MQRYDGKTALVTGAAAGIGLAIVRRLIEEGAARVLALDIDAPTDSVSERVEWRIMDVADRTGWEALGRERGEDPLHLLVNNAGISGLIPFDVLDYDTWRRFQSVNLESVLFAVQALHPALVAGQPSSVVNLGSLIGLRPVGIAPAYEASKGGLINLTRSFAKQFAARGENIRCNIVHPGSTVTEMMERNLGGTGAERDANMARRMAMHPLANANGRLPLPEDMAAAVAFLGSDDAAYITGIDLPVDGGASI
ncbi:MAG: SDR family oxidoreductase [Pseudomonadota bacterium]